MDINNILETLKEYWIIIIAITGFLYYFYKKEVTKLEVWQNEYFNKILVPFHLQCLSNPLIDIREFLNEKDIYSKEYIPSYIFYLAKKNGHEQIHRILVVDYEYNYPSQKGVFLSSLLKIGDVMGFFVSIGTFLMTVAFIPIVFIFLLAIILELIQVLQNNIWSSVNFYGAEVLAINVYTISLLICISFIASIMLLYRTTDYNDCYTSKKKIIEKSIKLKLKRYNNLSKKLIY